jgi:hypothetical protein
LDVKWIYFSRRLDFPKRSKPSSAIPIFGLSYVGI